MSQNPNQSQRWFPTRQQLKDTDKDPGALERAFRQLLTQHYALQDQVNLMRVNGHGPIASSTGPPPGCGPTDTMILGLRVAPVDVQTLADGTKLTWVKKDGNFQVK
jgi:hypothetical protein